MNTKEYLTLFQNELFSSCIPFWLKNGQDKQFGGVLNCLDRQGNVFSSEKGVWMQGRTAWTFANIYNKLNKDDSYLQFSKSCLDFEKKYCIDRDGRMFFTVTREGKSLRKRTYWFSETFYIIANAEYYLATGNKTYLEEAKYYFNLVYKIYLDPSCDPYKTTSKTYNQTHHLKTLANPMILLNVTSIMREADINNSCYYNDIITTLIDDIKCFYKPELNALLEKIGIHNEYDCESQSCMIVKPGHDIECSWFLFEEGIKRKDNELKEFAKKIFIDAIKIGWDNKYGGVFFIKDLANSPIEAYERDNNVWCPDNDMKSWWPQCEAIIASLMIYKETKEEVYLEWFEKTTKYAFKHFSDVEQGEWFKCLTREGEVTNSYCKGDLYKGAFHVMRMLSKCIVMLKDIK